MIVQYGYYTPPGQMSNYKRMRDKAIRAVAKAVRSGKLHKPTICEKCGHDGNLDGHHYLGHCEANQLDVRWLCKTCHGNEHGISRNPYGDQSQDETLAAKMPKAIKAAVYDLSVEYNMSESEVLRCAVRFFLKSWGRI